MIASDINGCREIFEDGVTGYGFAPHSPEELIRTLRHFLTLDRSQRAAMGEAARQKMIEEFDREKVAAAYLEEIHAAMEEPKEDSGKKGNSET